MKFCDLRVYGRGGGIRMESMIAVGIFFAICVVLYDCFVTLKMNRDELRRKDEINRQSKGADTLEEELGGSKGDGTSKTTGE